VAADVSPPVERLSYSPAEVHTRYISRVLLVTRLSDSNYKIPIFDISDYSFIFARDSYFLSIKKISFLIATVKALSIHHGCHKY
jgi:hypothetical protein